MKYFYALTPTYECTCIDYIMSGVTGNYFYFDTNNHTQVTTCVSQVVTFNLQLWLYL